MDISIQQTYENVLVLDSILDGMFAKTFLITKEAKFLKITQSECRVVRRYLGVCFKSVCIAYLSSL